MSRERILITVKTYPTLSRKHGETVCTAGVREDGSWVRIYPVPFRRLDEAEQYRKYDWLECDLVRSKKDPRPESCHPAEVKQLVAAGHLDTADNWRERRRLLLGKAKVHTRLQTLIDGAKANELSLAVFKPAKVTGFIWEEEEREWDAAKLTEMHGLHRHQQRRPPGTGDLCRASGDGAGLGQCLCLEPGNLWPDRHAGPHGVSVTRCWCATCALRWSSSIRSCRPRPSPRPCTKLTRHDFSRSLLQHNQAFHKLSATVCR
jgi:hypothetical protein